MSSINTKKRHLEGHSVQAYMDHQSSTSDISSFRNGDNEVPSGLMYLVRDIFKSIPEELKIATCSRLILLLNDSGLYMEELSPYTVKRPAQLERFEVKGTRSGFEQILKELIDRYLVQFFQDSEKIQVLDGLIEDLVESGVVPSNQHYGQSGYNSQSGEHMYVFKEYNDMESDIAQDFAIYSMLVDIRVSALRG